MTFWKRQNKSVMVHAQEFRYETFFISILELRKWGSRRSKDETGLFRITQPGSHPSLFHPGCPAWPCWSCWLPPLLGRGSTLRVSLGLLHPSASNSIACKVGLPGRSCPALTSLFSLHFLSFSNFLMFLCALLKPSLLCFFYFQYCLYQPLTAWVGAFCPVFFGEKT